MSVKQVTAYLFCSVSKGSKGCFSSTHVYMNTRFLLDSEVLLIILCITKEFEFTPAGNC